MRIGVVVDNDFDHDVRVWNEVNLLLSAGHEVFVLCFAFTDKKKKHEVEGLTVKRISIRRKWKNLMYGSMNTLPFYELFWARGIKGFVRNYKLEALHVHDLYMAKAGDMGRREAGIPLVLDLHENYPHAVMTYSWATKGARKLLAQPAQWQMKEQEYLAYADKIVVLGKAFADDLQAAYPDLDSSRFVVFPNVPDLETFASYPIRKDVVQRKDDEFVLFYFGVISERRGILTCFRALKLLKEGKVPVRFLLVGPIDSADRGKIEKGIEELNGMVTYVPWIDLSELPSYVEASDLCLSPIFKNPQHESGIANKVFQYMLCGKPLLVSNSRPQQELVEENDCGLSFLSDDEKQLAEAVSVLFNDPVRAQRMGENGRNAVLEKYNLRALGRGLLELYQTLPKKSSKFVG